MPNLKRYHLITRLCIAVFMVGFWFYGTQPLYVMAYMFSYLFVLMRAININSKKRMKFLMIVSYTMILILQISINKEIVFEAKIYGMYVGKVFSTFAMALPFVLERFFIVNKYAAFYFPSIDEAYTVSFNDIKNTMNLVASNCKNVLKTGEALSLKNLETIVTDLPRHNSFEYINDGSLTEEYFNEVKKSLDDLNIYVVISNTGSAASELISVFTKKQFNHASISFDRELKTIISYNGGDRLYPPGLNHEIISFFNQKQDASIIVYSLEATKAQKEIIFDKIAEINKDGSSYNLLGLVLSYSKKSNIMFCSQFVYKMLCIAGLQYFDKEDGKIKPTDFVELDYRRRLKFEYELFFK